MDWIIGHSDSALEWRRDSVIFSVPTFGVSTIVNDISSILYLLYFIAKTKANKQKHLRKLCLVGFVLGWGPERWFWSWCKNYLTGQDWSCCRHRWPAAHSSGPSQTLQSLLPVCCHKYWPTESQCRPRSSPMSPHVPFFFSLPFSSHLRTLGPLSFQAKLGQEISTLPLPQTHSCSCSTGGEPGPPLQERNKLRRRCCLPAGGQDVCIPLKDMPRSFLATWWAKICQWSLLPWQSPRCKFIERPRAKKLELESSVAAGRLQESGTAKKSWAAQAGTRQGLLIPSKRRTPSKIQDGHEEYESSRASWYHSEGCFFLMYSFRKFPSSHRCMSGTFNCTVPLFG